MSNDFECTNTVFKGLKIIKPFYVCDERGYFLKDFEKEIFDSFGMHSEIFEEFETFSTKNVIRGLHFQNKNPQIKIVRVIRGEIMDVVVDLRKNSETFGQWASFILSNSNHDILWIPAGFAHGFRVLSDTAIVSYKCIGKYEKEYDTGIVWCDPILNIDWQVDNPIVSNRDRKLPNFENFLEGI